MFRSFVQYFASDFLHSTFEDGRPCRFGEVLGDIFDPSTVSTSHRTKLHCVLLRVNWRTNDKAFALQSAATACEQKCCGSEVSCISETFECIPRLNGFVISITCILTREEVEKKFVDLVHYGAGITATSPRLTTRETQHTYHLFTPIVRFPNNIHSAREHEFMKCAFTITACANSNSWNAILNTSSVAQRMQ